MKLYQLDRNQSFQIVGKEDNGIYKLDHIDGMYSICYQGDTTTIVHLAAYSEIVPFPKYSDED